MIPYGTGTFVCGGSIDDPTVSARGRTAVLLAAGCLSGAPVLRSAPAQPAASGGGDPDGRALYVAQCAACHAPGGTGIPGAFPPLAGSQWVTGDERIVVRIVLHGIAGKIEVAGESYDGLMPPLGGVLTDAEIAAVATYVRTAWGNDASAVAAATVARERAVTAGRDTPWTAAQLLAGLETIK